MNLKVVKPSDKSGHGRQSRSWPTRSVFMTSYMVRRYETILDEKGHLVLYLIYCILQATLCDRFKSIFNNTLYFIRATFKRISYALVRKYDTTRMLKSLRFNKDYTFMLFQPLFLNLRLSNLRSSYWIFEIGCSNFQIFKTCITIEQSKTHLLRQTNACLINYSLRIKYPWKS